MVEIGWLKGELSGDYVGWAESPIVLNAAEDECRLQFTNSFRDP